MRTHTIAFTLASLAATALIAAGPLNPPAGSVQSTMKPLTDVEPRTAINAANTPGDADSLFKITQPGSYYLTGNLQGVTGKHGIEVTAGDVTIDLNGFTLTGVAGSLSGVAAAAASGNTTVRNGTVAGWGATGVRVGSSSRLAGLTSRGNVGNGLEVTNSSLVESCTVTGNGGNGVSAFDYCIIRDCVSFTNGQNGIDTNNSTRVERCIAKLNGAAGIYGGNTAVIAGCTADNNTGFGIRAIDQSTVRDCSASSNGGGGIEATTGVVIAGCTVLTNTGSGIQCGAGCRVEENFCRFNGSGAGQGAGISVTANGSRTLLINNTCTGNDWGIKIDAINTLVKGNTCSSNSTNFEIVAGNRVAVILTLPTSAAISGNIGGTPVSDPDANYAF